jgi:hypothetical protein
MVGRLSHSSGATEKNCDLVIVNDCRSISNEQKLLFLLVVSFCLEVNECGGVSESVITV